MNISKLGLAAAAALLLTASSTSAAAAPAKKERFYYEQRGEIVWEVKTDQKLMALTFDDGPDPEQTPAILDLLRKYNAKCTFFVVGRRVQAFPELAKRVVDDGHELGNHTFNHIYFNNASSAEQIRQQLALTEEAIEQATKTRSVLFRPPGGTYNDLLVEVSNKAGLKPVLWSWHQDTRDWKLPGVSRITSKVLHNARSGDIVLFHDHVHPRTQTIQALEIILPELQKRGYEFVTVSELLKHAKTQPVGNPAK